MDDPNRRTDRGDPQTDEPGGRSLDLDQLARSQARERAAERTDPSRDLEGDAAWSAGNPGLTGDAEPESGGTAEAGSGTPEGRPPVPGGK